MPQRALPFLVAAIVVALDQLSKAWVVAEVPFGARAASWGGVLHLTHTRNSGAAFGLLRGLSLDVGGFTIDGVRLLGLISLLVAVALAVWLLRAKALGAATRWALAAVMGGAIGNGIDRWRLRYVTDFIHAQRGWFDFPVFNVADIAITVGAGLLLVSTLLAGRPAHGGPAADRDGHPPSGVRTVGDGSVSAAPPRSASDR